MENQELLPNSTFGIVDDYRIFELENPFDNGANFVALDFETATNSRNSVCEIGIAVVKEGKVVEQKVWRVQPPHNEYWNRNILIHGIKPEDTQNLPMFHEIWEEVCPYLEGQIVVAHNTSFDSYVLKDSLLANGISFPQMAFICSCRLANSVFRELYSFTLDSLCEALNIPFANHHNAEADAVACAQVFLEIIKKSETKSYAELLEKYNFRIGRFSDQYFRPFLRIKKLYNGSDTTKAADIIGDPSKIDEDSYFYGKNICFTGKSPLGTRDEMKQLITGIGGIYDDKLKTTTNILVVAPQVAGNLKSGKKSEKEDKVIKFRQKGYDIEIMTIEDFISYIAK